MAIQYLSQHPFTLPLAHFILWRQLPCQFDHAMVQQWNATFQADRHAGSIYFYQDIVRQIIECIPGHHALSQRPIGRNGSGVAQAIARLMTRQHGALRIQAVRHLRLIKRQIIIAQHTGQLIQLVAPATGSRPVHCQRGQHGGSCAPGATQPSRRLACALTQCIGVSIPAVASKQLIAAIPRQSHSHGLACQLRHQQGWDLRTVGKRFVVQRPQAWRQGQRIPALNIQLGMRRPQMGSHGLGMFGLVKAWLIKTDGECAYWLRGLRLHQRHDGGRIHPTRQKSA